MSRIHGNNFTTTTNGSITNVATSIVLTSVTGFPSIGAGVTCNLTLQSGTTIEIVTASALSTNTITVARAQENTSAVAWASGSSISIRPTADSIDRKLDVASTTSTPAASTVSKWDSNVNFSANNFINGYTTTATAAGTTTLTVTSTQVQLFTGSTTQTIKLPVTSTLVNNLSFVINNISSGVVTVQSSGGNTLQALAANTGVLCRCISTSGTGTASWQWHYYKLQSGLTSLASDVTGVLPVANGGTNSSSVITAPAATTWAGWDANSNLSANNFLEGYVSIATAAGTTTLTVASFKNQIFTGITTQTVVLPAVSALALGTIYRITNLSSGVVTVQSSGANPIQAMQANSTLIVINNATSGTGATVWYVVDYSAAASGQTGSGSLVRANSATLVGPALGTPASGTLTNCTSIPVANATGILSLLNGGTGVSISPVCIVFLSATQSIPNNTTTKITFNSVTTDNNSNYDAVTNYRFTPTKSGTYLVFLNVSFLSCVVNTAIDPVIFKNGSQFSAGQMLAIATGGQQAVQISSLIAMNGSTDYIEGYVFQGAGSSKNIDTTSFLQVMRVGG